MVTGAASGIGRSLAEELARRGSTVILADVNEHGVAAVAQSIEKKGGRAEAVALDTSDFNAVARLVDRTASTHGALDYLFNNAGIAVVGEVQDISIEDWRRVIGVNLNGVINGVVAAYRRMIEQGSGHIVNTASIEGLVGFPINASYVTSKHGVIGLSEALRIEGKNHGVKVSVVCPGFIKTAIFDSMTVVGIDREKILAELPVKLGISADECALRILKGVERNRAIIVVTGSAKVIWWLHRLSPTLWRALIGFDYRRKRDKKGLPPRKAFRLSGLNR